MMLDLFQEFVEFFLIVPWLRPLSWLAEVNIEERGQDHAHWPLWWPCPLLEEKGYQGLFDGIAQGHFTSRKDDNDVTKHQKANNEDLRATINIMLACSWLDGWLVGWLVGWIMDWNCNLQLLESAYFLVTQFSTTRAPLMPLSILS